MAVRIAESHIARAMRDDEMQAVYCDDRPELFEQLRANNALAPADAEWSIGSALTLLVATVFLDVLLEVAVFIGGVREHPKLAAICVAGGFVFGLLAVIVPVLTIAWVRG